MQSKFEGGGLVVGTPEKFSEIGDESTLYTTMSDPNY